MVWHLPVLRGWRMVWPLAGLGAVALCGALAVILAWWRSGGASRRAEVWRAYMAGTITSWGLAQIALAGQAALNVNPTVGFADVLMFAAFAWAIAAFLHMPRQRSGGYSGVHIALDSLLIGAGITAVWWVIVVGPPSADRLSFSLLFAQLSPMYEDWTVFGLTIMLLARDPGSRAVWLAAGTGLLTIGDLLSMPTDLHAERFIVVPSIAAWGAAWVLLAIGFVRFRLATVDGRYVDPRNLRDGVSSAMAQLIAVLSVLTCIVASPGGPVGSVSTWLMMLLVILIIIREAVLTVIRIHMTRDLWEQAYRDPLTGLWNRNGLVEQMSTLQTWRPWVLLDLDLDQFHAFNAAFGVPAGDALLRRVGELLQQGSPRDGVVARIDGDEFAVLCPGSVLEGRQLAHILAKGITAMQVDEDDSLHLDIKIGIAPVATLRPGAVGDAMLTSDDPTSALVRAAWAMSSARVDDANRVVVFTSDLGDARARQLELERRLRHAIEHGLIDVYAQPIVDANTHQVVGFEALARWTDSLLGRVSPAEFVPIAEETGMVIDLGEVVLRRSFDEARACGVMDSDLWFSVNVSPLQLRTSRLVPLVGALLEEYHYPAERLILEVTEVVLVEEDDVALDRLQELLSLGVKIAIDDFGSGYSALGYLMRLPTCHLKIDRQLLVAARVDAKTRTIVSAIVDLGRRLDLYVVIEGVEDQEDLDLCIEVGADAVQGYYFAHPQPWAEAMAQVGRVVERHRG
jgi:diguanylate cyclase (GGDEF)-like protein